MMVMMMMTVHAPFDLLWSPGKQHCLCVVVVVVVATGTREARRVVEQQVVRPLIKSSPAAVATLDGEPSKLGKRLTRCFKRVAAHFRA